MVNNLIPGRPSNGGLSDEIKAIYGHDATPDSILQMIAPLVAPITDKEAITSGK